MSESYESLISQIKSANRITDLYDVGYPTDVYKQLQWTAESYGENLAWDFIDDGITRDWSTVLAMVDTAACVLHRLGVRKCSHIALMTNNIEEFPIIWLALAKIGAVLVPINNTYKSREIEYAINLSNAELLITEPEFLPEIESIKNTIDKDNIVLIGDPENKLYRNWNVLVKDSYEGRFLCDSAPDTLLNIQFTSGTTGFAKGCMLTHEYWLVLGWSSCVLFGERMSRIYLGQSFFYMIGFRLLLNAMIMGASLIVPKKPGSKRYMADVIKHNCDYCSMFEMAYKQGINLKDKKNNLKLVTVFGFNQQSALDFEKIFDTSVQEYYGMTEIGGALYVPRNVRPNNYVSGTCGVLAPFREVAILDEDGNEIKDGSIGELCVRGPGIMLAYYQNQKATDSVFANGWFKTGDLFTKELNGFYRIVGRSKDMIRRNGENVAAQEVEAVLRSLPQVCQVAAVPVPDSYTGEEIKVYIQLNKGFTKDDVPVDKLLKHASDNLAAFKVPRYFSYVDKFDLTDSLRVKKRSLTEGVADLRIGAYDAREERWY